MVSLLSPRKPATMSRGAGVPIPAETLDVELLAADTLVADRDAPMFSLLRSTVGLPPDDDRWWPEHHSFAVPTLTLLERTLAGLRAEPSRAVGDSSPPGRHRGAVVQGLIYAP